VEPGKHRKEMGYSSI